MFSYLGLHQPDAYTIATNQVEAWQCLLSLP